MKLEQIKRIKGYKSFQSFTWQDFFNNTKFHDNVNIFNGENGSGKSSICNILKSVSQNKDFDTEHKPEEIRLLFDDGEYTLNTDVWKKQKSKDDILFFDREFVDKNIHLGHKRGKHQEEQEQESGKMIIEFDKKAIDLKAVREGKKIKNDEQAREVEKFNKDNKEILNFSLSDEESKLFKKFKNRTKEETSKIKSKLEEDKKVIKKELEADRSSQEQVNDIQESIRVIKNVERNIPLSDYEEYQAIFDFDLKEQVKIKAEESLIKKIRDHKDFFETGIEIRKKHSEQCPFCQSKNEEKNIANTIQLYNDIFDNIYEEQFQKFKDRKQELVDELEDIKQSVNTYLKDSIFLKWREYEQKYKMKNIYSVDEERQYNKPQTKKIEEFTTQILNLKKPNKENIEELYTGVKEESKAIDNYFQSISKLINNKNTIIQKFKAENTDRELQKRIDQNSEKINDIEQQLTFFNENKINIQNSKKEKEKQLERLKKQLEKDEKERQKARKEYEDYVSSEAFTEMLQKMESYFQNFKFNFQLTLDTERKRPTKEYPFAFKVLDSEPKERDLKEGLSEGELQVLSLCFFFAFLNIQENLKNKILIFDDPITSLDDSNLSHLVDLIAEKQSKFSQVFIFTHHRTFFKFMRRKFKTSGQGKKEKSGNEYNIIQNKKEFGGSFICRSEKKKFIEELKNFETNIHNETQNGEAIDIELKVVEHGQYLRYEVERYIKNDLLHWNENEFPKVIAGIKRNKQIDDKDLDKIRQIYSFCNWTTSHVDAGDDHGLQQLKDKIDDFISIVEKADPNPRAKNKR